MRDPEFVKRTIEKCEEDKRLKEEAAKKEKRTTILSVIVLVLCLALLAFGGYEYIQYTNKTVSADTLLAEMGIEDQTDLDFDTYLADYDAGVSAANKKYQGLTVTLTGEVTSKTANAVMSVSDETSVLLKKTVNGENLSIVARFNKEDMSALKEVNVGDVLTFTGECSNELNFKNCKVLDVVKGE